MKVLHIASFYNINHHGGAELSSEVLINNIGRKKDINFRIFTLQKGKLNDKKNFRNKIIFSRYSILLSKKLIIIGNHILDVFISIEIKKIISHFEPDIIHVHDTYILPATILSTKDLDIPIVMTYHNDVSGNNLKSILDHKWQFYFIDILNNRNNLILENSKNVDRIIAISEYIKNELIANSIKKDNIVTIYTSGLMPNGILPTSYKKNHIGKVKLLSFGRIYQYKGFGFLIRSLAHIDNLENIELNIVGNGPFLSKLKKDVYNLGLENMVNFMGYIPHSSLIECIVNSDIVIFPTLCCEAFGRIALEGSYCGKPVIATNVGGISESVINGYTGILVYPNDEKEMSEAIQKLVNNKNLRDAMGENGKQFVRNKFNNEKIINQVLQVYNDLICKK